ncbi:Uncharacterized protein DBV15_05022 [Temnothorax longispinosus]|uniref:Uncharacterized protein n=1 Tax=Temnothorax longispinosus TaxID=300112 RepID=A0A4S2KN08_9HYME|nr:Uncharacterized protein DBV15_05022 [Temnothorax longispinosus]
MAQDWWPKSRLRNGAQDWQPGCPGLDQSWPVFEFLREAAAKAAPLHVGYYAGGGHDGGYAGGFDGGFDGGYPAGGSYIAYADGHHGGYQSKYHGPPAPLGKDGRVVDTPEVAHAKIAHLSTHAEELAKHLPYAYSYPHFS